MEMLKLLARAHFDQYGEASGFVRYNDLLRATDDNVELADALFYELIGFRHDEFLSAKQRYEYRKLFFSRRKTELLPILGVKTLGELPAKMREMEIVGDTSVPAMSEHGLSDGQRQYARLIADYFLHNEEVALETESGETVLAREYFSSVRVVTTPKQKEDLLSSPAFGQVVTRCAPGLAIYDGAPVISQQTLFISEELTPESYQNIIRAAALHCVLANLDVPERVYYDVMKSAASHHHLGNKEYLRLFDYACMNDVTITGLFTLCGLSPVDHLHTYNLTGSLMYPAGAKSYNVFTNNSIGPDDYATLVETQINDMFLRGELLTLHWKNGVTHVNRNKFSQPLNLLYL